MYEELGAVLNGNTVELRLFLPDAGRDPTQYERGVLPRIRAIVARGTGAPYPRGQERVLVVIRNRTAMQRDGRPE